MLSEIVKDRQILHNVPYMWTPKQIHPLLPRVFFPSPPPAPSNYFPTIFIGFTFLFCSVFKFVCSPQFTCGTLNPNVMAFGDAAFGEDLGLDEITGVGPSQEETRALSPLPLSPSLPPSLFLFLSLPLSCPPPTPCLNPEGRPSENMERRTPSVSQEESSPEGQLAGTLIFPAPRTVINKH